MDDLETPDFNIILNINNKKAKINREKERIKRQKKELKAQQMFEIELEILELQERIRNEKINNE